MRAIDADALKEDLRMGKECDIDCPTDWKACHYDRVYAKQDFCEWIDDAPTIEPERKKGKWIDRGWSGDGRGNSWHEWECSECKHITKGAKWDFCPNCGARMEDGE